MILYVSEAGSNHSTMTRGRAVAARQAHNLEVAGSNPAPATKSLFKVTSVTFLLLTYL